jgi:hypothetical protein
VDWFEMIQNTMQWRWGDGGYFKHGNDLLGSEKGGKLY